MEVASLTVDYRTPSEVMAEAEPVVRAVVPDANVPVSVRSTGLPAVHRRVPELDEVLHTWLTAHTDGTPASSATRPSPAAPVSGP